MQWIKKGREEGKIHIIRYHRYIHISAAGLQLSRDGLAHATCLPQPTLLATLLCKPVPTLLQLHMLATHLTGPHPPHPKSSALGLLSTHHSPACPHCIWMERPYCPTRLRHEQAVKLHASHSLLVLSGTAYTEGEENFPNLKKINFISYFCALQHTYKSSLRALPVILWGMSFTALLE